MSEDTLKLAQAMVDPQTGHGKTTEYFQVAAALIDLHERMGKIEKEARHMMEFYECWPEVERILALTKVKSQ